MESTASTLHRPKRDAQQISLGLLRVQKNVPQQQQQQQQLQFDSVTSNWDNVNTFFTPQLDQVTAIYKNHTYNPCPWTYEVDHDFNRYPQYIHHARCHPSNDNNVCYHSDQLSSNCICQQVNYTIPILTRTKCDHSTAEQHWTIDEAIVYGACVPRFTSF